MPQLFRNFVILLFSSLMLIGCGGGDNENGLGSGDCNLNGCDSGSSGSSGGDSGDNSGTDGGTDNGTTDDTDGSTTGTTNISFFPLNVLERDRDFSGFPGDDLYRLSGSPPFILDHVINPITADDLMATNDAVVTDFRVTVDNVEIDPTESFPRLQKVVGGSIDLRTALVFDLSGSTTEIDISALVAEAKTYVADAFASDNEIIAGQAFVVWAFGTTVLDMTGGFTRSQATIEAALDQVESDFNAGARGSTSNLHQAIVEAVGRYTDDDVEYADVPIGTEDYDYDDLENILVNDLVDYSSKDQIDLSQLVIFSSGPDTSLATTQELMITAIGSQGFLAFDGTNTDAPNDGGDTDNTEPSTFTRKPVFYYVVGGEEPGVAYQALSAEAEAAVNLSLVDDEYDFSADLISRQIEAIENRINIDTRYVYTYAFVPRSGNHDVVFESDSTGYNSQLTYEYDGDVLEEALADNPSLGLTPEDYLPANGGTLVEITGSQGEYLAQQTVSLAELSSFAPATRWTNVEYGTSDYAWSLIPSSGAVITDNGDGTIQIDPSSLTVTTGITLRLTNTVLGQTFDITVNP